MFDKASIQHLCERLREVREDIRGLILFGSAARGEESPQDVDLLVVLAGPAMERRERDRALVGLRQALGTDGLWVDLVVVTEEGLRRGLENHHPFYLDIAADGVVLYDADGIEALLERARQEIAARRIRRTESGGWEFPVPYRGRVPLSPLDNVAWARRWLEDGERDLQAAEGLLDLELYDRSVTHSQQAVEKSVKAVLACMGRMERSHYVSSRLRALLGEIRDPRWQEQLKRLAEYAANLEPAAVGSRYPTEEGEVVLWPAEQYGREDAEQAVSLAREGLAIGRAFVDWWGGEAPAFGGAGNQFSSEETSR